MFKFGIEINDEICCLLLRFDIELNMRHVEHGLKECAVVVVLFLLLFIIEIFESILRNL